MPHFSNGLKYTYFPADIQARVHDLFSRNVLLAVYYFFMQVFRAVFLCSVVLFCLFRLLLFFNVKDLHM